MYVSGLARHLGYKTSIFPQVIARNRIALTVAKDGIHFIDNSNPQQAFIAGKVTITKS
jgi:hypothetical protein